MDVDYSFDPFYEVEYPKSRQRNRSQSIRWSPVHTRGTPKCERVFLHVGQSGLLEHFGHVSFTNHRFPIELSIHFAGPGRVKLSDNRKKSLKKRRLHLKWIGNRPHEVHFSRTHIFHQSTGGGGHCEGFIQQLGLTDCLFYQRGSL